MTRARDLADLLTGGQTITTADNSAQLTLESTDTDASVGPVLNLSRDNSSAADNDLVGEVQFNADDDGNNQTTYGKILTVIEDASDGSEDGLMQIHTNVAGTLRDRIKITSSEMVLNEESIDSDFRVEGNGDANLLFVDAGNDRIGIGTNSPSSLVSVVKNQAAHTNVDIFNNSGNASARGQLRVGYDASNCLEIFRVGNSADIKYNTTQGGDLHFQISGSTKARVNGGGTIISENVSTTSANLELNGAATAGHYNILMNGNSNNGYKVAFKHGSSVVGTIITTNSSTAYNTSSDYRLKQNVEDMTGAIDRVKALAPKRFQFIADADTTVDGFLAHEAQTVVPEAVHGTHNQVEVWIEPEVDEEGNIIGEALPDGVSVGDNKLDADGNTIPVYQGIDQSKLVPLLTAALKESITKIETLETEMTALKARVTTLEGE
jgi:hypothetical protein